MISVTELRAGTTFKVDNQLYQVIEYRHTKLGRGTANIKVKIRNLTSGAVVEKTFLSGNKVEPIDTMNKQLQFLYQNEENLHFMDPRSFEQFSLNKSILAEKCRYLKEGEEVKVLFYEEKPLSIELPISIIFEVVSAPPGVKGDTVSASTKPVTLDNDLVVRVPLFVNKGDKIKVDTRTGEYIERVKEK